MQVIVAIAFDTTEEFNQIQEQYNFQGKVHEDRDFELFTIYTCFDAQYFWFVASYEELPQLNWKISSPIANFVLVEDIYLYADQDDDTRFTCYTWIWGKWIDS